MSKSNKKGKKPQQNENKAIEELDEKIGDASVDNEETEAEEAGSEEEAVEEAAEETAKTEETAAADEEASEEEASEEESEDDEEAEDGEKEEKIEIDIPDPVSEEEAKDMIRSCRSELYDAMEGTSCLDPDEVIMSELGLEPDYLEDILF